MPSRSVAGSWLAHVVRACTCLFACCLWVGVFGVGEWGRQGGRAGAGRGPAGFAVRYRDSLLRLLLVWGASPGRPLLPHSSQASHTARNVCDLCGLTWLVRAAGSARLQISLMSCLTQPAVALWPSRLHLRGAAASRRLGGPQLLRAPPAALHQPLQGRPGRPLTPHGEHVCVSVYGPYGQPV